MYTIYQTRWEILTVDKKKIWRDLSKLRKIKTWQLLVLLIFALFISATLLRLNNIGMIQRREAVLAADKVGDDSITADRLYDLQRYVSAHMNTNLGQGVYLENSYNRDLKEAYSSLSSTNIYAKVQNVCEPQFSAWSTAYVQCVVSELAKYPSGDNANLPDAEAYVYNYVSPVWSLDFAGLSVLITVVILIMILARFTGVLILKAMLHSKNKLV